MRALVMDQEVGVRLTERPLPTVAAGSVLVRVRAAGICGSDLHVLRERRPELLGRIRGHEFSGDLPDGTRVSVNPLTRCGECVLCR